MLSKLVDAGVDSLSLAAQIIFAADLEAYAAASRSSDVGSTARRMVAALFWIRSPDALIPAIASSPPPAQVATYPKE